MNLRKWTALLFVFVMSLSLFATATYTVRLEDTFGDSWNGGALDVLVNGTVVLDDITVAYADNGGDWAEYTVDVVTGDEITTVYTAGNYPTENQYFIYDWNGEIAGSDGLDSSEPVGISTPIIATEPSEPSVNVSETAIDFADTGINATTEATTITVSNSGVGSFDVTAVTLAGTNADEFALTDANTYPATIETNEITFDVAFAPLTAGDKEATLTVAANGEDFVIALTGTALGNGTLVGTITDIADNSAIEGAVVMINGETTTTAVDGTYSITVMEGTYSATFTAPTFNAVTETGVEIVADAETVVDTMLTSYVMTTPYSQDFEGDYLPMAWEEREGLLAETTEFNTTSSAWGQDDYAHISEDNKGAKINNYGTSRDEWLLTPYFDLGDGTTPYRLDFDMALTNWNNPTSDTMGEDDKIAVVISTDAGMTWSDANTLLLVQQANEPDSLGTNVSLDLASYTGMVRFGFYAESTESNQDYDFHIDNVTVVENSDAPIVAFSSTSVMFDDTFVDYTSDNQTITVSNLGGGSFDVTAVALAGTDVDQFIFTDENTYPVTIEENEITFDIAFAPTSEGDKTATITVTANEMDYEIALTGTGTIPMEGELLDNAIPMTFTDSAFNATGSNVDYHNMYDLPASDGNDIVFAFSLTEAKAVDFSLQNSDYDTKIAVYGDSTSIDGWVPGEDNYLAYNDDYTWPTRDNVIDYRQTKDRTRSVQSAIYGLVLPAGDYFFILDSYGTATGNYDLDVMLNTPTAPVTNLVAAVEETTVTLTWEAPSITADGYNVYRDDVMINTALVTELTYVDAELEDGTYTYGVTAVFGEEETDAVTASATIQTVEINDPTNLNLSDNNDGTARFSWSMPGTGGGDGEVETFDGETLPEGWAVVDNDGDSYTWEVSANWGGYDESAHCMTSASYINNVGALTPDNWLISPAIAVPAGAQLKFFVNAQDPSWAGEHFNVKVSTTDDAVASFTNNIYSETIENADWHEVVVDLSEFAGQTVYFAWQHSECTDMFSLNLDNIEVMTATRSLWKVAFEDEKDAKQFKTVRTERELTGFNVYLNDALVENTTSLYYDFSDLTEGTHTFGVEAVYDEGTSNIVEIDYEIVIEGDAPINVSVEDFHNGTATMTWQMPGAGGGDGFSENFDAETLPMGWQVIDNDGDSFTWEVSTNWEGNNDSAHCMTSASYINNVGALTPDNWLVSPAIDLGTASELHFFVGAQDPSWAGEHFNVMISTTSTEISAFTEIYNETIENADWHEVVVDLSEYANETVYLAWQHTDCTDMFSINLDDVSVTNAARAQRDLTGFNVYLEGVLYDTVTATSYTFTGLDEQSYTAGVEAVYTNITSDLVEVTFTVVENDDVPAVTALTGNYPNPFNPETTINFSLNAPANVLIEVYNVRGQKVKTLVNEEMDAENHTVKWYGNDDSNQPVSSGVYFYKMKSGRYTSTKKMILLK